MEHLNSTFRQSTFGRFDRKWIFGVALILLALVVIVLGITLRVTISTNTTKSNGTNRNVILADGSVFLRNTIQNTPLIDGHNDLPYAVRRLVLDLSKVNLRNDLRIVEPFRSDPGSHTDIPRMRTGGIGAQFFSAYVTCAMQWKNALRATIEQIDFIRRMVDAYTDEFTFAVSAKDVEEAFAKGKIAALIGVEGGHSMDGSLGVLRAFHLLGVRYMTLTHNCDTPWAQSHVSEDSGSEGVVGLTDFGRAVIREMNRLGMLVDLSHVAAKTMHDALDVSSAPVIFSHSSSRSLCNSTRNVPDNVLRRMKKNGGVVMVTFVPKFVACADNATLSQVADHVDYVKLVAGEDHVGLGGDYDGVKRVPVGLEDVSKYPVLLDELLKRGWSPESLRKLVGENILRVMKEAERVAQEARDDRRQPREAWLSPGGDDGGNCSVRW